MQKESLGNRRRKEGFSTCLPLEARGDPGLPSNRGCPYQNTGIHRALCWLFSLSHSPFATMLCFCCCWFFVTVWIANLRSCWLTWVVVVKSLTCVWLFVTPGTAAARLLRPPLPLRVCSDSRPLSLWCYLTISFAFNLSWHQGLFQWIRSLPQVAKLLELQLRHQSFQWLLRTDFLWDWLVWSPCCPRGSQESSSTTTQKLQFFSTQPSLWSNSHICTWLLENQSFDYMDLCQQSDDSDF